MSRTKHCVAASLLGLLVAAMIGGCESPPVPFTETKRIDEPLTEQDLSMALGVLKDVGEKEQVWIPRPFLPPPNWSEDRTLPVCELVATERDLAEHAWSPAGAAERLPNEAHWNKALAAHHLTKKQFCALALSIAAALGKATADADLPLERLARQGTREIDLLLTDERPFASLPSAERYATLRRAAWVAIAQRATRLALVPEANARLVDEHREQLTACLPAEFFADPFAGLYPRPEDYGIPFEEGEVSDAQLTWQPADALIGDDVSEDAATTAAASSAKDLFAEHGKSVDRRPLAGRLRD